MPLFKKKVQAENIEELRDITDDVVEADFVPYACHWNPHSIVTKNGEVLQTIALTGFVHGNDQEDEDADLRSKIREAILKCVTSTKYGIWVHTIRRRKSLQTGGEYKRDFAGYLNRFWNDRNDWEHQFSNEVYISIVREGQKGSLADPKGFFRGILPRFDIRHREAYLDDSCRKLDAVVGKILPMLKSYGARRLGVVQRDGMYYSELTAFLGKIVTMADLDFPVKDTDIAYQLTNYDVTFGFNAMEVRMREDGKRRFGALLTMKEYRELPIEALDRILQVPAEFIISQCFEFIGSRQALKDYGYQKELFDISKSTLLIERTGLKDIIESNKGRQTDYGLHQLNMFLLADTIRALESGVSKAVSALASLGMTPMREDIKFEEGYWAQLPGNFEFIRRMRPINTARIGGFANLSNYPTGEKDGGHWGPAVTTFYTAAHTPYFFNFHVGDNGHTTLIGPSDGGKTLLLNFLLAEACKFDAKMFFFDNGRGAEIFLRSINGAYYNLYPQADARPYAQLKINPFQMEDTPVNRSFLCKWGLSLALEHQNAELISAVNAVIAELMVKPKPERTLNAFIGLLKTRNPAYEEMFSPWIGQGEFAALFDHAEDTLTLEEKVYGFETADLFSHDKVVIPVLSYLLHRIHQSLDGKPTIIAMAEAWSILESGLFGNGVKKWLDMLREKNAIAVLATEEVEDIQSSPLNAEIMKEVATQIYLPDETADETYAASFGLNEREITYLTVMNTDDRHFLLKRGKSSIVIELNLSGMKDIIAVLSASADHLHAMDQAIEARGMHSSHWMPKFLESM
jgi:type IV secretion system protein VirB4